MSDYNITREEMIEPVERMYEREYGNEHGMFEVMREEDLDGDPDGNIDVVYIQGDSQHLHVIRIEEAYDDCMFNTDRGLFSLRDVEANYCWIAVPLYELREGEEQWNDRLKSECERRGVGVITAQKKGRGVSAKVVLEAQKRDGNFLGEYGELAEEWAEQTQEDTTPEGFKVVDYYKR